MSAAARTDTPLTCAQLVETVNVGGAENLAIQIANRMAARGHASHILVIGPPGGDLIDRIDPGVGVHALGYRRASVVNPLRFAASLRDGFGRIAGAVREHGIGVLQTHLPNPNMWGLALALRKRCGVVATIHNNVEFSYGNDDSFRGRMRHAAYRRILRHTHATVAVSEEVGESLREKLGVSGKAADRLVVVPNGVPVPALPSPERRAALRAEHGVGPDEILVVSVGRICEQKNFGDLVRAAARLPEDSPLRLLIAGDGPDRAELEALLAAERTGERVRLLGNVSDVHALLDAADLFAMPSLWEGLPLALLEAMAAGLPVVGNRIAGITDVTVEGETSLLADPGDVDSFAEALARLGGDADQRTRLGAAGRRLVIEHYDLERVIDRLEFLYRGAAG
jgi:glycosyltransferase involved in cell wall biosynthesis